MLNIDGVGDAFDQLKEDVRDVNTSKLKTFGALVMGRVPEPYTENAVFQDHEGAKKSFAPHYEHFIKPEIQEFERRRIATLKSLSQRAFFSLCLIVAGVVMGLVFIAQGYGATLSNDNGEAILKIILLVLTGLATWCYWPIRKYKSSIKETIFPKIFSFFGPDFHYSPKPMITAESLERSGILPDYDKAILEDGIQGSYQNVALDIMSAHLKEKRNRSQKTVFKGIFVCLSMNKWFAGQTIVKKDAGLLMNWTLKPKERMEKVTLEDPLFEQQFEVFSTDQIEARYLLTTSFMERLRTLSDLFGRVDLQASFYDQNLLIMIPLRKQYFDTGSIFEPATFTQEIQLILNEMNVIFKIIDELKLNEKTGL
jgi:hypothetical protein